MSWNIKDHSRASLVVPRHHLNAPELISISSIFRPRSILMGQMWPSRHGSRLDGAMGLENSDSSPKIIAITLRVERFHHDLTHENMGQRVTRTVYRRTLLWQSGLPWAPGGECFAPFDEIVSVSQRFPSTSESADLTLVS